MQKMKAVIVDDVKLIRAELKSMLIDYSDIEVVGEASNGKTAIEMIKKLKPDVVFLDIQLPVLSGFKVLDSVEVDFKIIFVSSFDKYMPEAQKYKAVDFLMKPINKKKLAFAIRKLSLAKTNA